MADNSLSATELVNEVKAARTAWLEQHGVPISMEFVRFIVAIGQLCDYVAALSVESGEGTPQRKIVGKFSAKYGISGAQIVNTVSGEVIPEDEPLFLLRGRDHNAIVAINAYQGACESECNELHMAGIQQVREKFCQFAANHPERMKQPGITRHLKLESVAARESTAPRKDTATAEPRLCKYGDPTCPCPDGDLCHYEGKDAWPAPAVSHNALTEPVRKAMMDHFSDKLSMEEIASFSYEISDNLSRQLAGAPAEKTATGDYCRDCREPVTGSVHVELVSGKKMCFRCFKRAGEPQAHFDLRWAEKTATPEEK